jgi:hypothetical protein
MTSAVSPRAGPVPGRHVTFDVGAFPASTLT